MQTVFNKLQTSEAESSRTACLQVDPRLNLQFSQLVLSKYLDLVCLYPLGDEIIYKSKSVTTIHRNYKQAFV